MKAIELGYDYAREHFECPLPIRLEHMDATAGPHPDRRQHRHRARLPLRRRDRRRLVPDHAVDLADGRLPRVLRASPHRPGDRQAQLLILQAEDELAAIGMVIGARWNGARAFTSTSGPGHLADGGAHRPRVLRRDPGGDRRRAARRARRPACRPARSRATCWPAPTPPTATPATSCSSRRPRRSASSSRCRPSTWPSASRRRCSCCSTSTSA